MKIFYGKNNNVTNIYITILQKNNVIIIPKGDSARDFLVINPIPGIPKNIIIGVNDKCFV